jgi:hypothetical protein
MKLTNVRIILKKIEKNLSFADINWTSRTFLPAQEVLQGRCPAAGTVKTVCV